MIVHTCTSYTNYLTTVEDMSPSLQPQYTSYSVVGDLQKGPYLRS